MGDCQSYFGDDRPSVIINDTIRRAQAQAAKAAYMETPVAPVGDVCHEEENEYLSAALTTVQWQLVDCRKALTACYEAYSSLAEMFAEQADSVDGLRVGQAQAALALLVTGLGGQAVWLKPDDA